jgi:hypothetical protein
MNSATKGARVTTIVGGQNIDPTKLMAGAIKSIHTKTEELELKRKETTPAWWTLWLTNGGKDSSGNASS